MSEDPNSDEKKIVERLDAVEAAIAGTKKEPIKAEPFWPEGRPFLDFAAKYIGIFGALSALLIGAIGGVSLWKQTNDMIARAETKIAKLTGVLEPDYAEVNTTHQIK